MREIKLRVWDKTRKMMFEAVAYYPTLKSVDVIYKYKDGVSNKVNLYGDTFELMQYTGLKDKNGKEIFEGDICTYNKYTKESGRKEHSEPKVIFWDESKAGFEINPKGNYQAGLFYWEYEIIGNIYENPELLIPWL